MRIWSRPSGGFSQHAVLPGDSISQTGCALLGDGAADDVFQHEQHQQQQHLKVAQHGAHQQAWPPNERRPGAGGKGDEVELRGSIVLTTQHGNDGVEKVDRRGDAAGGDRKQGQVADRSKFTPYMKLMMGMPMVMNSAVATVIPRMTAMTANTTMSKRRRLRGLDQMLARRSI